MEAQRDRQIDEIMRHCRDLCTIDQKRPPPLTMFDYLTLKHLQTSSTYNIYTFHQHQQRAIAIANDILSTIKVEETYTKV